MGMQQLDLFASFGTPPVKEKAEAVVPIVEEANEAVIFAPGPVAEEKTIIPPPIVTEASLIFADTNIAVRIKPKAPVSRLQTTVKEVVPVVKSKSKRGRKSYKEIDAELDLIEIPDEETLNQKLYYSITEVAKWFKVNASLLRYWENEFDILKPRKNRKGDRLFRPEDIKNLQVIYYLLRNRKFSLEGAKKYLRNNRHQADVNVQLAQSLTKFRSFLLELKANLGA